MTGCCNKVIVKQFPPNKVTVYNYPPYSSSGGSGELPTIENAIGLINGANAIFTSTYPFLSATLEVFENGQLLNSGVDYTILTNQSIQLNFSPSVGEIIKFIYIKS